MQQRSRASVLAAVCMSIGACLASPAVGQLNTFGYGSDFECSEVLARQGDKAFEEAVSQWVAGYWSGLNIACQSRREGYQDLFPYLTGEKELFPDLIEACKKNDFGGVYGAAGRIYTELRHMKPGE